MMVKLVYKIFGFVSIIIDFWLQIFYNYLYEKGIAIHRRGMFG